jgi:hypothetical protein
MHCKFRMSDMDGLGLGPNFLQLLSSASSQAPIATYYTTTVVLFSFINSNYPRVS